ncbi:MAG: hypothetical protein DCC51_13385 [Anaerolineae bacterium]|nr:MAG: hypothetical protein DCC51_13385 [Anaerolineae bacterium]
MEAVVDEVAQAAELEMLRARNIALRGDLAITRGQRDATQAALDKANRDNDGLRTDLRKLRARVDDLECLYQEADRIIKRFIDKEAPRALVDGTVVYYESEDKGL